MQYALAPQYSDLSGFLLLIRSDPKHIFSRPYIEMLARRSKVDPLSDCPLGDGWKVVELDLDRKMSDAPVKCFFAYRGAVESELLLVELKVNR